MARSTQERAQYLVDTYAADVSDYEAKADKFRHLNRWTGDNPVLLLADAAATSTGRAYFSGVKPAVERFRDEFLRSGKVTNFKQLAELENDPAFRSVFPAERWRRIACTGAEQLATINGSDDLVSLQEWASGVDPANYEHEPIGNIRGVGLRTFQYLRMLAGEETVKPDIQVKRFLCELAVESLDFPFDIPPDCEPEKMSDMTALRASEWLAANTTYSPLEIDQIAWWTFANTDDATNGDQSSITSEKIQGDIMETHGEQVIDLLYRLRPGDVIKYEGAGGAKQGPVTVRISEITDREGMYCIFADGKREGEYVLFPQKRASGQKYDPPEACYIDEGRGGSLSEMALATHGTIQWLQLIVKEAETEAFADS